MMRSHISPHQGTAFASRTYTGWRRFTFGEFSSRMGPELGVSFSALGLAHGRFQLRGKLESGDIRRLCEQVSVPARDFGIEV